LIITLKCSGKEANEKIRMNDGTEKNDTHGSNHKRGLDINMDEQATINIPLEL
jgi:hypothetical protein